MRGLKYSGEGINLKPGQISIEGLCFEGTTLNPKPRNKEFDFWF